MSFFKKIYGDAGIAVKNNSEVPLLVIVSQLTPLYWGKVEPGQIWNIHNHLGMGKVSGVRTRCWLARGVFCADGALKPRG